MQNAHECQVSLDKAGLECFEWIPRHGRLGPMIELFVKFLGTYILILTVVGLVYTPHAVYKCSLLFAFSPLPFVICFNSDCYFDWGKRGSQCPSDVHLSDGQWGWAFAHIHWLFDLSFEKCLFISLVQLLVREFGFLLFSLFWIFCISILNQMYN